MAKRSICFKWCFVLLLVGMGGISSLNLSISDNAFDLLPEGAVSGELQMLQDLGLVNRIFITVSVPEEKYPTAAAAQQALFQSTAQLGTALEEDEQFANVLARLAPGYEWALFQNLWPSISMLLTPEDLAQLAEKMTPAGLKKVMENNFLQLNSPAGIALKRQLQQDPLGLMPLFLSKLHQLKTEFSMQLENGFFVSQDKKSCLILAESRLSLTDSHQAARIQATLEKYYRTRLAPGVEARVIGTLPHTLANSHSVQRDLHRLLPLATVLLILLLGLTLRDIRALLVLSIPFLAAPPAIALTAAIFGNISALSLGFGIVLLGIAVDFSIHLYLTLSRDQGSQTDLLRHIRRPILFATLTTTTVLLVLLLSTVPSHRQMATLALSGILLAVSFAWLLIPTFAAPAKQAQPETTANSNTRQPAPFSWQISRLAAWGLLISCGLLTWPQLKYNGDLRVLDAPDPQVKADEHHFNTTWEKTGQQAFVISSGDTLALALNNNSLVYNFLQSHNITPFQSLAPLLPGLEIQEKNRQFWNVFWAAKQPKFEHDFAIAAQQQGFTPQAFAPFFRWLDHPPAPLLAETRFPSSLQAMTTTMIRSPEHSTAETKKPFLIMTTVAIDDTTLPLLLSFADKEPAISVLASNKWRAEIESLLRKDIFLLSLTAGILVLLLISIQFKKINATLAVLAPVLSALAAMSVFCWLTAGALNMMHLIMGIMVIGLSVDYGIFVICAELKKGIKTAPIAVSICAASSLIGFGVLALATHPALHALGITVLIGIGAAWPTALFVSPILLHFQLKKPASA